MSKLSMFVNTATVSTSALILLWNVESAMAAPAKPAPPPPCFVYTPTPPKVVVPYKAPVVVPVAPPRVVPAPAAPKVVVPYKAPAPAYVAPKAVVPVKAPAPVNVAPKQVTPVAKPIAAAQPAQNKFVYTPNPPVTVAPYKNLVVKQQVPAPLKQAVVAPTPKPVVQVKAASAATSTPATTSTTTLKQEMNKNLVSGILSKGAEKGIELGVQNKAASILTNGNAKNLPGRVDKAAVLTNPKTSIEAAQAIAGNGKAGAVLAVGEAVAKNAGPVIDVALNVKDEWKKQDTRTADVIVGSIKSVDNIIVGGTVAGFTAPVEAANAVAPGSGVVAHVAIVAGANTAWDTTGGKTFNASVDKYVAPAVNKYVAPAINKTVDVAKTEARWFSIGFKDVMAYFKK